MLQNATKNATYKLASFNCEICHYKCSRKNDFDKHLLTDKHKMLQMSKNVINCPKIIFDCICGNNFSTKSGLTRHKQHCKKCYVQNINSHDDLCSEIIKNDKNFIMIKSQRFKNEENIENKEYKCICGKIYLHSSSYYRHNKKCKYSDINSQNDITSEKIKDNLNVDVISKLLQENKEIKEELKKMSSTPSVVNNYITNTYTNNSKNINNNHFNIQMFLNEKCKDAMNIDEFVKSLNITLDDLAFTKKYGLRKGLTELFLKGLKKISIYERPFHCTDLKRETIYVKYKNKWDKTDSRKKFKEAIDRACDYCIKASKVLKDTMKTDKEELYFCELIQIICDDTSKVDDRVITDICKHILIKKDLQNLKDDVEEIV
jgi:hypothetical protein